MKKFYVFLSAASMAALCSVSAQQLPNAGFEDNWGKCTPWTSKNNSKTHGETPSPWCISHVIGMGGTGATEVGIKDDGYNSATAVKLKNTANPYMASQIVPGYISFGTSWSTAKVMLSGGIKPTNADGGAFGGLDFTGRPDAVSFMYKRAHGTATGESAHDATLNPNEVATIIAYSWKGHWTQEKVPGEIKLLSDPSTVTMTDRDRNILGMDTPQGGAVTKSDDAVLIAKFVVELTEDKAEWTEFTQDLEYLSNATPAKFNLIMAAGDYFSTTPGNDNELTVDDVKLLYYSRLASLKVNGTEVMGFAPETYEYDLSDIEMPADASAISYSLLGNSGTANATVALDTDNNQALITVTNPQGADKDGKTAHVYTIKFAAKQGGDTPDFPEDATIFKGTLTIEMMGSVINKGDLTNYYVYLTHNAATGNYDLSLPKFSLDLGGGPTPLGDINIEDVKCETQADGTLRYTGKKDNLSLADGAIVADVVCDGTESTDGNLVMKITVAWKMDETTEVPIDVTFEGTRIQTGVESVGYDNSNAPVEYFDLQGRRLSNPTNGFVIRRQGNKIEKVIL